MPNNRPFDKDLEQGYLNKGQQEGEIVLLIGRKQKIVLFLFFLDDKERIGKLKVVTVSVLQASRKS